MTETMTKAGKVEGKVEGKTEGEIKGRISTLEELYSQGILVKELFEEMVTPLKHKLNELLSEQQ